MLRRPTFMDGALHFARLDAPGAGQKFRGIDEVTVLSIVRTAVAVLSFIAIGASVLGVGFVLQRSANAATPPGRITYVTTRFGGVAQIVSSDLDGGNLKQLTTAPGQSYSPSLSPDGQKILFTSDRDGPNMLEIYSMNSDGTGTTRLTNPPMTAGTPSWSSDGKKIVFAATAPGSPLSQVFTANADGSNQLQQTRSTSHAFPVFSPDGSHIAAVSTTVGPIVLPNGTTGTGSIQTVHIQRVLDDVQKLVDDQAINIPGNTSYPTYADPTRLFVTSFNATFSTAQLFTYDITAQTAAAFTKVGTYAADAHVDANWVVYATSTGTGVQLAWMPRAGGAETVLALGPGDNYGGTYRPVVATSPAAVTRVSTGAAETTSPTLTGAEVAAGVMVLAFASGGIFYWSKRSRNGSVDAHEKVGPTSAQALIELKAQVQALIDAANAHTQERPGTGSGDPQK